MTDSDVLVIGGGPAGLAAALAAHSRGVSVAIVDEYPELGGQFFRQPFHARPSTRHAIEGARLIDAVHRAGIEVVTNALAWDRGADSEIELAQSGRRLRARCRSLVLATGACEFAIPFKGWTLPGVMTVGGGQALAKWQDREPGARVVIAGSGPFLFAAATELVSLSVNVTAVVEANRLFARGATVLPLWRHVSRAREAAGYLAALAFAGVRIRSGRRVVEASGNERVESVVVAKVDDSWRPVPGTEERLEADALLIGNGFSPQSQLTQLLECAHEYRDADGWSVAVDENQETSVSGVFAAGEVTGVAGAQAAAVAGRIAGLCAAHAAGGVSDDRKELQVLRRRLRRHRAFAVGMSRVFRTPADMVAHVPDDVVVCRCEDVTAGEIRGSLAAWNLEPNSIRRLTRAGMGLCQGRTCGVLVAGLIRSRETGAPPSLGLMSARPPIKPIPLSIMASVPGPFEDAR